MPRIILLLVVTLCGSVLALAQSSGTVGVDKAVIRSTPSAKGTIVTRLIRGETVEIISRNANWLNVRHAKYRGWIASTSIVTLNLVAASGSGSGSGSGYGTGSGSGRGSGSGVGNGPGSSKSDGIGTGTPVLATGTAGLKLLSQPAPSYTVEARRAETQGSVILRVTFLANGTIGIISPVKRLPFGLTEQAMAAAKLITFQPARANGVAVSVTKQVEYTFTVY